jgi:hypothetical protein
MSARSGTIAVCGALGVAVTAIVTTNAPFGPSAAPSARTSGLAKSSGEIEVAGGVLAAVGGAWWLGGVLGATAAAIAALALSGFFATIGRLQGSPVDEPARPMQARYASAAAALSALILALACAQVASLGQGGGDRAGTSLALELNAPSIVGALLGAAAVRAAMWLEAHRPRYRSLVALTPVVVAFGFRLALGPEAWAQVAIAVLLAAIATAFASPGASAQAMVKSLATTALVYFATQVRPP